MTRTSDGLVFVAIAVVFSALGIWAYRTGGRRRLWLMWIGTTVGLELLAILDWRRVNSPENPLIANLLAAAVPTLAAAWVIRWTGARGAPTGWRLLIASTVCFVLIPITALIGLYFLSPYLR